VGLWPHTECDQWVYGHIRHILAGGYKHFRRTCSLHLQRTITLNVEALGLSETVVVVMMEAILIPYMKFFIGSLYSHCLTLSQHELQ
jgi:hypothetical protein